MGKEWTETPWGSWKWQDLGLCLRNLHQHTKIFSKAIGNLAGSDTNGDVWSSDFFFYWEWFLHPRMVIPPLMFGNIHHVMLLCLSTSSTAQGGGGSFKNRKPIGELGCCEPEMAERIHWWTERCLRYPLFSLFLWLSTYLPAYLLCIYLSIDLSIYLSLSFIPLPIYLSTYLPSYLSTYLPIYLCTYLPIYLSLSLSLSFICLSV